jgi:hypothetical protein
LKMSIWEVLLLLLDNFFLWMSCLYLIISSWMTTGKIIFYTRYILLLLIHIFARVKKEMHEIIIIIIIISIDRLFLIHMVYCHWLHMFLLKNEQMVFFHMVDIVVLLRHPLLLLFFLFSLVDYDRQKNKRW